MASRFESVNPQWRSQIYTSFNQFKIFVDILQSSYVISVQLTHGASAGFAKMILRAWPCVISQMIYMTTEHQVNTRTFRRVETESVIKLKKKK